MDLQARKLKAIEYLIGLQDEMSFREIESTIAEVRKQHTIRRNVKPLTAGQLADRAARSNSDYLAGRFKTQEELEKESNNW